MSSHPNSDPPGNAQANTRGASAKERLDKRVVDLGLAETRAKAQALILAGQVLVNDNPAVKAGDLVRRDASIRLRGAPLKYVSRGGLKLEHALDTFALDVTARIVLDIGASTGGFTDCVLQRGATRVYAVDVGYGQLHEKLRQDARVVVLDKTNARDLSAITFDPRPDFLVSDVSFISLKLILPEAFRVLAPTSPFAVLVKPQFEVGREHVGKGGIVRDAIARTAALDGVIAVATSLGATQLQHTESPITGTDGNIEYLLTGLSPRATPQAGQT